MHSLKPEVIIESHIPGVPTGLSEHFNISRLSPEEITPLTVADADALIVRTRTRCDASLLAGSQVRFVATATIGTDHLDLPWLDAQGITAVSAPGCNAPAVAQYVFASIAALGINPAGKSIAVVGIGHVGTIVARWAQALGMTVIPVDPPRQRRGDTGHWFSLQQAASLADIITFHTPLNRYGIDSTYHLVNDSFLHSLKPGVLLINAARGPLFDTPAVIRAVDYGLIAPPVIDCWENEPNLNLQLLDKVAIATPHIAGYSAEGKQRATSIVIQALCQRFGKPLPALPPLADSLGHGALAPSLGSIADSYNPLVDTLSLRANPADFEKLRNFYNLRHEVNDD